MWIFEARVDEVWSAYLLSEGHSAQVLSFDELPPVMYEVLNRYHARKH